ncbi:MAG: hypothetical protein MSC30_19120 [Gaiellaceae bacterium MAG52_C11]|nr:hypothetical protein [Candidatus Gaiellasilicea maunaloa]
MSVNAAKGAPGLALVTVVVVVVVIVLADPLPAIVSALPFSGPPDVPDLPGWLGWLWRGVVISTVVLALIGKLEQRGKRDRPRGEGA